MSRQARCWNEQGQGRIAIEAEEIVFPDEDVPVPVAVSLDSRRCVHPDRLPEHAKTDPGIRGDTASGGSKPATLETGAVIQVPTFGSEEELVMDLLTTDGVLVHPGYFFDFPRESYVIVSLLPDETSFAEGVKRMLTCATNRGDYATQG